MSKWCSPNREGNKLSCYTKKNLENIVKSYNKICPPNKRIKINNKTKTQLWNALEKALSDRCNNEICWAKQSFVNDKKILKESFRPQRPKIWEKENYTTWLNTYDIRNVMKQYEKKYPDFLFIGPIPLDCGINGNLQCELTNLNINKIYKKGINKVGIIWNSSPSYMSGEHWFSSYICINKNKTCSIEYYDSVPYKPLNEVLTFMDKIKYDLKNGSNINSKIKINKTRHQYDDYNCGIFSMLFIINRLKGKTMNQIEKMKLDTKKMQKLKMLWYRD